MKKIKRTISLLKHPFRRKYKEKLIISQNLNKSGITLPSFYKSFNVPITTFRNMKKTRRKLLKVHNHIFIEHSYGMAVAVNVKIRAKKSFKWILSNKRNKLPIFKKYIYFRKKQYTQTELLLKYFKITNQ